MIPREVLAVEATGEPRFADQHAGERLLQKRLGTSPCHSVSQRPLYAF